MGAVDNFDQVQDLLGCGGARRRFNGAAEGPCGIVGAIIQEWMNDEINDDRYKELLQALKGSGAAKDGSVSVPAKKKRRKDNNAIWYVTIIFMFYFLFFVFVCFLVFFILFLFYFFF